MGRVEDRLAELGIKIPETPVPLGSYKPASVSGNLIFISGQLPLTEGKLLFEGKVGSDVSVEDAARAARVSAINALAAIKRELGGFGSVRKIVKVTGYVASAPGFYSQAAVVNGASDLFFQVFGEEGRHARAAVGVAELPMNAPVEVELIAEINP
ncbi:MAG TPA: RidA family protein [Thermodesulfobacteriota bacterium]|nr:RidA family protein [Thermodesulfobacteriota bacterium]